MPTVPRSQGQQVASQPYDNARVSSTATEETFGGGAAKAAVTAGIKEVTDTASKMVARENALNTRMATVSAMNEDKAEILKKHYDTTPVKIKTKDSLGNDIEVESPSGYMLRQGKNASLEGGVSRLSIEGSDAVIAKRMAALSPDEQQIYLNAMSTWVPTINDHAATYETTQLKASTAADMDSTLEYIARDPVTPFDQKVLDIKSNAKLFSSKLGLPVSEYKNRVEDASYKAAKSSLATLLNSDTGTTEDAEALIDQAKTSGVNSVHIKDLKGDIEESKIKGALRRNQGIQDTINASLEKGLDKDWWGKGSSLEKLPATGDQKIDEQIAVINANRKKLGGVEQSDKAVLNGLKMMMVDPNIPNNQKSLEIYKATAEGSLSRSDWDSVTSLYFLPPEQKQDAQIGVNGINEFVKNNVNNNPAVADELTNDFMSRLAKKKPDETANDIYDDVIYNYATRNIPGLANTKKEDMPSSVAKMQGGHQLFYQKLGSQPTKKKPDMTIPKKEEMVTMIAPDGTEKDVPKSQVKHWTEKGAQEKNG